MTPVERIAIRAIALLPGVSEEAKGLLLDLASGRSNPSNEPTPDGEVSASTRRWRRFQERKRANASNGGQTLPNVGANAMQTAFANGSAPPDPPENLPVFSQDPPSERGSETRVRAGSNGGPNVVSNASQTRPTNATADGAGGLAVSAWAEGIRKVTGKAFSMPRGGTTELATLIHVMCDHCPDLEKRVDWARAEGRRFAEVHKGKLSAFSFKDWLNSPEAGAPKTTPIVEGPAVLEERARRKAAHEEAERNAAPPPAELLEVVGLKPKKGAA